jgi:hypothetical protein
VERLSARSGTPARSASSTSLQLADGVRKSRKSPVHGWLLRQDTRDGGVIRTGLARVIEACGRASNGRRQSVVSVCRADCSRKKARTRTVWKVFRPRNGA